MNTNANGLRGKVVLITGASSGIGESAARLLAANGGHVVLGARRVDRLERIAGEIRAAGGVAEYRKLDVTNLEDFQAFVKFAQAKLDRVDVLVNNAGLMPLAPLEALKVDEWNQMIDVNIRGVLHGIAASLPVMKAQGHGHIVNVSSIAAHAALPTAGVYCATKAAVNMISGSLRQETNQIRCTIVSPGVTESELAETTTHDATAKWLADYRKIALPAEAIARAIRFAIEQPEGVDVNEIVVRPTATT